MLVCTYCIKTDVSFINWYEEVKSNHGIGSKSQLRERPPRCLCGGRIINKWVGAQQSLEVRVEISFLSEQKSIKDFQSFRKTFWFFIFMNVRRVADRHLDFSMRWMVLLISFLISKEKSNVKRPRSAPKTAQNQFGKPPRKRLLVNQPYHEFLR